MHCRGWWCRFVFVGVVPILCLALLVWISHGPAWAWAVAALGFAIVAFVHGRHLARLAAWLDAPESSEFPQAAGIWGEVFGKLSRHLLSERRGREEVEERLRSFTGAMDAVPDGLVIIDAGHQILWSNRAAAAHMGIRLPRDKGLIICLLYTSPSPRD